MLYIIIDTSAINPERCNISMQNNWSKLIRVECLGQISVFSYQHRNSYQCKVCGKLDKSSNKLYYNIQYFRINIVMHIVFSYQISVSPSGMRGVGIFCVSETKSCVNVLYINMGADDSTAAFNYFYHFFPNQAHMAIFSPAVLDK